MMKLFRSVSIGLLLLSLAAISGRPEGNQELSGTWEGTIHLADLDIDLEIVLVLEEKNGAVTGRITDDWGYLDCDVMDPELAGGVLTFKAMVESSRDDHLMVFRLTAAGVRMEGQWESLGSYGDWSLNRKMEGKDPKRKELTVEDIVGVWSGPAAYKSNPASKNVLTLVLEKNAGGLHGTFSDQFDNDYRRVEVKSFEDNALALGIEFTYRNETYVMEIDADVRDETHLRAKFSIDKMSQTGIWEAEKKSGK